ncbi:MAG: peptidase P60 [Beijerinckiaceae bacterium]|jgi:NlpC/P60 family putative phage cell wall peptidase|nr:peptidase P60 [Beijerinckiaceae bacterium]
MSRDGRDDVARREEIVRVARGWIGTPYQHQASLKGVGADCLGLLRGVWREAVGEEPEDVPAYSPAWAELGAPDQLLGGAFRHLLPLPMDTEIRLGMMLLFRWRAHLPAKHCGIATGPETFVHAHDGASVAEVALVPLWRRKLAGLFDFPARRD